MERSRLRIVVPAYPAARKTTALGPVYVASAVNEMEGWDAEVVDENNLRRYGPRGKSGGADHAFLQDLRPAQVVGLYGGLTSTIPRLYEVARFYKDRGIVTVAGGQHFIGENIAEALSCGIDYVVIGEGEETIKELLEALRAGRDVAAIKGIAFRQNGCIVETPAREPLMDFERLPAPDFSLVRYATIRLYPVGRIRGCGMNCEFCTVKGKPRFASVERFLEDISRLVETHGARHFFIVDDLFGQQREETLRFCRMLRRYQERIGRRLVVTVQIRLDKAKDIELLTAMRQAGIQHVAIGFESPVEEELKAMDKRVHAEEMLSLARTFHKFGFWVHGMFIFGYPAKGGAEFDMPAARRVRRFRRFIKRARIDSVQILLPVPLPGTQLRKRLVDQNRVYSVQDVGWEFYDGNFPLFEPDPPLTAPDMQAAAKQIMGRFYHFRHLFMVAASILSFPALALSLHRLRLGWGAWYRRWQNSLIGFGGWITIRRWTTAFRKSDFLQRLQRAREHLGTS
jgi:radical SAM superfamily enzyme YgiQ (UPF0313 family)